MPRSLALMVMQAAPFAHVFSVAIVSEAIKRVITHNQQIYKFSARWLACGSVVNCSCVGLNHAHTATGDYVVCQRRKRNKRIKKINEQMTANAELEG